jgi:5-methylcytosine-specific restriction endonuclease McrA
MRQQKQTAWCCRACGSAALLARGFCRACYDRRRHSLRYFGGHRESILARDRCCQTCLSESGRVLASPLVVHHRRPGNNQPALHIALCRSCHLRVHRRRQLPGLYSDLFFRLWRELHPSVPAQLRLPLAA